MQVQLLISPLHTLAAQQILQLSDDIYNSNEDMYMKLCDSDRDISIIKDDHIAKSNHLYESLIPNSKQASSTKLT